MSRYTVNEFGQTRVDEFLARVADKAEGLPSAEAEQLFDRQWKRIYRIRKEDPGDWADEDISSVLVGLAVMRSMARVWKETHQ